MGQTKRKWITIILLLPITAAAECFTESVIASRAGAEIREVAEYEKSVSTLGNKQTCIVRFKAKIGNKWHEARAESQGLITDSTDQVCSQAMQTGRIRILEKVEGFALHSTQTQWCNDFKIPQIRKGLNKNDTFKISELKPHPAEPNPFEHKGTQCRYFLESDIDSRTNDLKQWEIIGCFIRNEWTVVDKF
jgi:hypothetical protein